MPEITGIEGDREGAVRLLNGRRFWPAVAMIEFPFPTWTLLLPCPICENTEASHRCEEKKNCATRDHRKSESRKYRIPLMLNPSESPESPGSVSTDGRPLSPKAQRAELLVLASSVVH